MMTLVSGPKGNAMRISRLSLPILSVLVPSVAYAHPGHPDIYGFSAGFAHPFTGLDHMLAMFAVGLVGYRLGGRARWLVPAAFVACVALGGGLTATGINIHLVEAVTALSVLVLGALAALRKTAPLTLVLGLTGLFGLFHGYAHMVEIPQMASVLSYGGGFLVATAGLHAAGFTVGLTAGRLARKHGPLVIRSVASVITLAGLALFTGAF